MSAHHPDTEDSEPVIHVTRTIRFDYTFPAHSYWTSDGDRERPMTAEEIVAREEDLTLEEAMVILLNTQRDNARTPVTHLATITVEGTA